VAADRAGVKVDTNHIIERLYDLMDQYHYLIIEGAGGLLVPLTWEMNYLDLAAILHAQVLIIGRTGLGTINHTLLTYQTLKRAGIKILGVVLNNSTGQYDSSIETNPEAIARLSECSNIITLPYWSSISPSSIAQLSQPHLSQVACWITAS
jgi:dethiobiotin synthetase